MFIKQVLDNGPHLWKLHRWQTFLSQFNVDYECVAGNNNFLADYLTLESEYPSHDNSRQAYRLKDIVINFNEYVETISVGLKQRDTGVKTIVDNIRVEVEEVSKRIDEIIKDMKKNLEQEGQ